MIDLEPIKKRMKENGIVVSEIVSFYNENPYRKKISVEYLSSVLKGNTNNISPKRYRIIKNIVDEIILLKDENKTIL